MASSDLFRSDLRVINVGLPPFQENLIAVGVRAVQVDWKPPMDVDPGARRMVAARSEEIARANETAVGVILRGRPSLIGLNRAIEVIPGMQPNTVLHAGPPITWERMCGPMKGAIRGGLMYEGVAETPEEADRLAGSGEVIFAPCHEHSAVGPMAGVVTPSMPVFVIKNEECGNHAYCTMNEGLGKVLRYGAYDETVIMKLWWMERVLYPDLQRAVVKAAPIDLRHIIAQALHMGDEVHNRNRAATSLFYRAIAPSVIETCEETDDAVEVLEFIHGNDHFFLNLSMAAAKATLDPARDIKNSSIVVAMTRNGTDFGVQLSGTGGEWFTGEANLPDALFFPGFTKDDANRDIGDSSITETNGLGGFAIAASPAIVQFVGGRAIDAVHYTRQMYEIVAAESNVYQIPYLDFRGTPTGIDVVKIVEKNVLPFIDTGVAHKQAGMGQIGAGVLRAPHEPFRKAFEGLAAALDES